MPDLADGSRFGLWWRTFSDDDTFSPFPRNTAPLMLMAVFPLLMLVFGAPLDVATFYTLSVLCVMLHLFMIYLCGTFGRVVTGPALVFGFLNVGWIWGLVGTLGRVPGFALVLAVYVITMLSIGLKRLWVQGRADEIALTLMSAILLFAGKYYGGQVREGQIGIGILRIADAVDIKTIRAVLSGTFLTVTLVSAGFLVLYIQRLRESAPGATFVRKKLAYEAFAFVCGFIPLVVVRICVNADMGPALVALLVLCCYCAIAYVCGLWDVRVESWALVALLLCATLSMALPTDVNAAPPVPAFASLLDACRTSVPVREMLDAAAQVVHLCSGVVRPWVDHIALLTGSTHEVLPPDLIDAFSFYLGFVILASVMGIASLVGERVRMRRRIEARLSSNTPFSGM